MRHPTPVRLEQPLTTCRSRPTDSPPVFVLLAFDRTTVLSKCLDAFFMTIIANVTLIHAIEHATFSAAPCKSSAILEIILLSTRENPRMLW